MTAHGATEDRVLDLEKIPSIMKNVFLWIINHHEFLWNGHCGQVESSKIAFPMHLRKQDRQSLYNTERDGKFVVSR